MAGFRLGREADKLTVTEDCGIGEETAQLVYQQC
jgi:hypothetical protein